MSGGFFPHWLPYIIMNSAMLAFPLEIKRSDKSFLLLTNQISPFLNDKSCCGIAGLTEKLLLKPQSSSRQTERVPRSSGENTHSLSSWGGEGRREEDELFTHCCCCCCFGLSAGATAELPATDGRGQSEAAAADEGGAGGRVRHRERGGGAESHRDGERRSLNLPVGL